ncbi:uncharacterized protein SCHCODRAFT_02630563 [Schizophyllum commune H4-8]|uniref:uncharacterized protein n=1 Tax=Schizophyllum commune (strain H4-8 / FGSC 9210) TaxID=578458 RepID=UPI00215F44D0|nr:uncharacterized protein SCHCODRAFT_02630563 [Schizophyllum commune H4-8]KAI5889987.1 hypothetical protein SCHCODRAFT_02630563 [Schizophyllum commune H4-8]
MHGFVSFFFLSRLQDAARLKMQYADPRRAGRWRLQFHNDLYWSPLEGDRSVPLKLVIVRENCALQDCPKAAYTST